MFRDKKEWIRQNEMVNKAELLHSKAKIFYDELLNCISTIYESVQAEFDLKLKSSRDWIT